MGIKNKLNNKIRFVFLAKLYRRTDENGYKDCCEYFDITKIKVMPLYCTEEQLLEEKNSKNK